MIWRESLDRIAPDYHGAIDFAELQHYGIAPDDVVDFSVNSNPFGPVGSVREAVRGARLARYPDKACLALREALGAHLGIGMDGILVGNGSAELMSMIAFARLTAGDNVLIVGPTFGEYGRNARLMGATVTMWQAQPENDFAIDYAAIGNLIATDAPSMVHLCNPNNPTGQIVPTAVIAEWAKQYPETLFVIDEAYISFVGSMASACEIGLENVIVLRSMTKDYSLAGLRLGYVLAPPSVIAGLARVQVPWSVNELAQAAGIAALAAQDAYVEMWRRLDVEAVRFRGELLRLGFRPKRSNTHYFLMEVGDGAAWRDRLLKHGLLVRLCESYGLPSYVRISTQTPSENDRLLAVLSE